MQLQQRAQARRAQLEQQAWTKRDESKRIDTNSTQRKIMANTIQYLPKVTVRWSLDRAARRIGDRKLHMTSPQNRSFWMSSLWRQSLTEKHQLLAQRELSSDHACLIFGLLFSIHFSSFELFCMLGSDFVACHLLQATNLVLEFQQRTSICTQRNIYRSQWQNMTNTKTWWTWFDMLDGFFQDHSSMSRQESSRKNSCCSRRKFRGSTSKNKAGRFCRVCSLFTTVVMRPIGLARWNFRVYFSKLQKRWSPFII